jgi:peptide/nickel transport system substrate-binding protein
MTMSTLSARASDMAGPPRAAMGPADLGRSHRPSLGRRRLLVGLPGLTATVLIAACGAPPASPTAAPAAKPTIAPAPTQALAATAAPTQAAATPPVPAKPTAAAAATPAATAPAKAAPAAAAGTLTATFFGSVNPWTSGGSPQGINAIFNRLVEIKADYQTLVPALADSWKASDDGLNYTFTLRKDVKWHDGRPFTAADVVFSLKTLMDPKMGGWLPAASVYPIKGAKAYNEGKATEILGLKALDDYTVQITAEEPTATFLTGLSSAWILPRHHLEAIPVDQLAKADFFASKLIGTGSYMLKEFVPDQHLILTRNPSFFRGAPKIETIVIRRVTQPGVAILGQQRGEFDVISLTTPDDMERVRADANLNVWPGPPTGVISFTTNVKKPAFADKRVRQALVYALDRETILKTLWKGAATVANSPILAPWVDQSANNPYPFDPARAKQLLGEAGWNSDQTIELMMEYTDEFHRKLAAVIQQYWKEVGVNATIRQAAWANLEPDVSSGKFDLLYGGQAGGIDPHDCSIYYTSASKFNKLIANPELDRLFAQGIAATDRAKRAEIYKQAAKILNDEAYWPILWAPDRIWAAGKHVQGIQGNLGYPGYHRAFYMAEETWTIQK